MSDLTHNFTTDQLNMVARLSGADPRTKIIIDDSIEGNWEYSGHKFHFTNRSGDIIRHPSAYSKCGWSSLVYKSSTYCIKLHPNYIQKCIDDGITSKRIFGVNTVYLSTPERKVGNFSIHMAALRVDGNRMWLVMHPDHNPYHAVRNKGVSAFDALYTAIKAWRVQRASDKDLEKLLDGNRFKFIGIPHLKKIGACTPGAEAALEWISKKLNLQNIGAVRADVVFKETANDWRSKWAMMAIMAKLDS